MCYDDNARPPLPPGEAGAASGRDVELSAADGNRFAGYLALPAAAPRALVLVLPDIRGLHQFYKDLALRFAEAGLAAVALDYFGRTAGIGPRDESFEFWPHVQQLTIDGFLADAAAALDHGRQAAGGGLAAFTLGFCMGGALSFQCGTRELGLAGVVGFYAGLSRDIGGGGAMIDRGALIRVPALGLFGGDDPGIPPEQVAAFDAALDTAGVPHAIVTYPGAPHSFFDRRQTDFAAESADAWRRVLDFIGANSGVAA